MKRVYRMKSILLSWHSSCVRAMGKFKYKSRFSPPLKRGPTTPTPTIRPRGLHDFELLSPAAKRWQPKVGWVTGCKPALTKTILNTCGSTHSRVDGWGSRVGATQRSAQNAETIVCHIHFIWTLAASHKLMTVGQLRFPGTRGICLIYPRKCVSTLLNETNPLSRLTRKRFAAYNNYYLHP